MKLLRLVPDHTNFDFFRPMRFWLAVSLIGTIATFVILPIRGLNFGVDFLGGTLILAEFPEHRDISEYRELLSGLDVGDVAVTEASGGSGGQVVLMRIGTLGDEVAHDTNPVARVQSAIDVAFPGATYLQVDTVGGKVSGELVWTGVLAVGLALAAVMVYVWLRFEWQFAIGAVVSLLHDVVVTVGVFSLLQLEFDLTIVAGLLTIIGFSINDTVVVFDRVRENLRKYKRTPLKEVINLALNETLSRTAMTVVTTLIALFSLLFFGGPVVFGFAFASIFGIVVGTYSSIWVASAIVLWFGVKRDWSGKAGEAEGKLRKSGA
ncbi:protein translocase subunit SecF [Amaricoccus sp.]|uniref:protein translocase subunit SecF n=1 Tax=Amaricoccus sp. TaxID=1872485 RepID=UPI001B6FACE3|nr:protein translocase subunit SecF [Amaricoccus sp.]MBP7002423.1 protein translocase subunit SecF [Amaricoccus sp.]